MNPSESPQAPVSNTTKSIAAPVAPTEQLEVVIVMPTIDCIFHARRRCLAAVAARQRGSARSGRASAARSYASSAARCA